MPSPEPWLATLALAGSAGALLLAPLAPAIAEWRRPSDVAPLPIGQHDTLDPPCLAHSFAERLAEAIIMRRRRLGDARLARAPAHGRWPLRRSERQRGRSRRLWHAERDLHAPDCVDFLAEVAAPGALHTAADCTYRALWSGGTLRVAERATVLRWAHAAHAEVAAGARLLGRLSADESITLHGEVVFSLLHAPAIGFGVRASPQVRAASAAADRPLPDAPWLPIDVDWSIAARRGVGNGPLQVAPHAAWDGDLVSRGDLALGWGCHAGGSLKARGGLRAGPRTAVAGNVVAAGPVTFGKWSAIAGSVISETAIVLDDGCVVGSPDAPATVAAPFIEIGDGAVVHGTVWASKHGRSSRRVVHWEVATLRERVVSRAAAALGVREPGA